MDRTWSVEIEGKKHIIEIEYPVALSVDDDKSEVTQPKDGKLVVDGNLVHTFKSPTPDLGGINVLPKEVSFEIEGKPAVLRKKGLFSRIELVIEGQLIKPVQ